MKITRRFTKSGHDPFASVKWVSRSSRISNPDGSVVFEMADAEVPESWSQLATDIMVSKYFRKAGVPQMDDAGNVLRDGQGRVITGPERSAQQVIHRLCGCWRHWGEKHGYFDSSADAQAFYDEMAHMLVHQMAAPNSPQWFNTGLNWAYGVTGPAQGHWCVDPESGRTEECEDAYTHPQPHACFIQSVRDDLVGESGIMDLWTREARLFKYGSGTGTNFSSLRGEDEPLSGGGKSSGLMSWLKIGDRAAGAIKSGGTTRRAAKMVCLDLDHPDIEQFISWKVREELKVAAMVEGMRALSPDQKEIAVKLGLTLDYDFNGEAYQTVSGQNANNSVRIPHEFFEALDAGGEWRLVNRTSGEVAKTLAAGDLWEQICFAAWRCADPGVQYDTTINEWHTCPAEGRINASNPCSEYLFLDDTACNLASLNMMKFYDSKRRRFDVDSFEHAVDLWTITLEISVLMAAFPSEAIARKSYDYRTLGLGYANLGAMLMQAGIPYDSEEARSVCAMVTAIMCGRSYRQSAVMAKELGAFARFDENRDEMLRVIRNHRRAARGIARDAVGNDGYEQLSVAPVPIDHEVARSGRVNIGNAKEMLNRATHAWDEAGALGEKHGYRNAQVTVIAPTGTIGLLMDCDTTGVEPDFALVKFKKLAGGGYFKIANASLRPALEALGYSDEQVRAMLTHVLGTLSLDAPMPDEVARLGDGTGRTFAEFLLEKGLTGDDLARVTEALPGVFELKFAFNAWTLGDEAMARLGIDAERAKKDSSFDALRAMGLTRAQIAALDERLCGTQTMEGTPHLKDEHLAVFDCANACGKKGRRFIGVEGHIRMMAAAQPFISGAISKTINLPNNATIDEIGAAYRLSWELGLKANALYRDGCKLSQPLSTKSDSGPEDSEHESGGGRRLDETELRLLETEEDDDALESAREEIAVEAARAAEAVSGGDARGLEVIRERIIHRPLRRRLPDTRQSLTHKFNIAGHEGYLTVGLYEDGLPGELFITMAKEGSTIGGLMDSLGTAVSVALQYGVPVESLVNKFTHQRFEPAGMTTNRDIPFAKSLVDYIFRWVGNEFVPGYRDAMAPARSESESAANVHGAADADTPEEDGRRIEVDRFATSGTPTRSSGEIASGEKDPGGVRRSAVATSAVRMTTVLASDGQTSVETRAASKVLSLAMRDCQGDAPACDVCGTITVRSGTCYKCLNCGHSMGCS